MGGKGEEGGFPAFFFLGGGGFGGSEVWKDSPGGDLRASLSHPRGARSGAVGGCGAAAVAAAARPGAGGGVCGVCVCASPFPSPFPCPRKKYRCAYLCVFLTLCVCIRSRICAYIYVCTCRHASRGCVWGVCGSRLMVKGVTQLCFMVVNGLPGEVPAA